MLNSWLIAAVCLLFFPIGILLPKANTLVGYERGSCPRGLAFLVLALDPIRAAVGAWAFLQGMGPLAARIGYEATGDAILLGSVLGTGLLVQTFSRQDEDYVFSPFAYLAGVLIFFCGPVVAVPAMVLGIGSAVAMRVWTPFFFCAGMVVLILGPVSNVNNWQPFIAIGLACMLPPLAAVMASRHMGFPRNKQA